MEMNQIEILFYPLYNETEMSVPVYATEEAAGCDLIVHNFKVRYEASNSFPQTFAPREGLTLEAISLLPNERILVGCGFSIALPKDWEMQVRSRSGKALKEGLVVLNAPGTIDSDYRGEICVILINNSFDNVLIHKGEKIAQALFMPVIRAVWKRVSHPSELRSSERGENGFGSTGR